MAVAASEIALLKSEASFLEQQCSQSHANENKLIELVNRVYLKLERASTGNDPDLKHINKTLREIITQRTLQN